MSSFYKPQKTTTTTTTIDEDLERSGSVSASGSDSESGSSSSSEEEATGAQLTKLMQKCEQQTNALKEVLEATGLVYEVHSGCHDTNSPETEEVRRRLREAPTSAFSNDGGVYSHKVSNHWNQLVVSLARERCKCHSRR